VLQLLPWFTLAIVGTPLAIIDAREHRLPNRGVALLTVTLVGAFGAVSIAAQTADQFLRAALGGLALAAVLLVCALVSPPSLGMGDVKLAFSIGMALTWLGWMWLWFGICLAFTAAGGWAIWRRVRRGERGPIPLGPFLIGAPLGCALAAAAI
jgi:leader peptidase (prepilin peptidase)/N-methyltransferase